MTTSPSPATPGSAPQVWFLTGSQGLYGEETLAQVERQSRAVAAVVADAPGLPVQVVWKPVLTSADAIRRALVDANGDDACVGVVAWMHTFSPAKMWISGLDALRKPLLHLHTQADASLPWGSIDMNFMNLNQAAHGDREFGFVQTRLRVPRTTVAGHAGDARTRGLVESWARAALGVAELRRLRLARFGDNMRDVAVTEGDKVEAELRFGTSVNTYGVNDLVALVDAVEETEVDVLVKEYADAYAVAPELLPGGERHGSLRYAAQIEAGLRRFLTGGGFGAFTTNFEDLGGLRQLPGLAVQRLMADGYGFGGEGDWKTSVLLRTLKTVGAGRPGGTSFMEDYTYHLGPGPQRILGAHMLEVCPSIAAERPTVEIHPLGIGAREDPVRMRFTAAPGEGLVVGMCDLGERFRLVGNGIRVVEPDEELTSLPVAAAVWEPQPDLPTSAECWLMAGGPHHTVLSTQVGPDTLHQLAELLRTELVFIDDTTTRRDFTDRLRWNAAYQRLSLPL
ncbi:L-arabinose isomerase [Lapillicoccus jejuensis]|uniref:L-arabinose isomerase n=1 Tax=Lapillicoccus jejuensis TaxID=402171 RepID=A0A542DXX2_9MICO|nr:L-arabinose isomerase [Lapillicoccus jejuensis]TQJ07942.1 L-arabinose isomerase [Lapillicoccus jejuensis]